MMNLNFLTLETIARISTNATDLSIHYAPDRGNGEEDYRIRVSYANNYGASIIKRVPIDDSLPHSDEQSKVRYYWEIAILYRDELCYCLEDEDGDRDCIMGYYCTEEELVELCNQIRCRQQ